MKSFATSICPIKKSSRSEYEASPRHPRTIPAPSPRHPSAIPAPSPRHPRAIPARRDHHPTDLKTVSFRCHNRSSARRPCPEGHQSHPRAIPALYPRHPRIIPAWQIGLRHGDLAQKDTRVIPTPSPHHPRAIPVPSPHHPSAARPSPNRSQNGFFPVS